MEVQSGGSKMGSRKILVALWILAAIGGVALFEWDMTPRSGRYQAGGQSAGPGPARYLVMREWRRNTDYQFVPSAERRRHPDGGLLESYPLSTDKDGFIMDLLAAEIRAVTGKDPAEHYQRLTQQYGAPH